MISKQHRRDVVLGDWNETQTEYHVRLFGDEHDGDLYWVDFQIFTVVCTSADGKEKFFNRKGWTASPDPVSRLDEAEPIISGHVKWDGCSDFDIHDAHTCSLEQIKALLDAVLKARELAAAEMPHQPVAGEYA